MWLHSSMCAGRNRHFRVLWSSKGGKTAVLMPTERSARVSSGGNHQLFLHTLVCNTSNTDKLLTVRHENPTNSVAGLLRDVQCLRVLAAMPPAHRASLAAAGRTRRGLRFACSLST